jgi:hypothetical protein
MDPWSDELTRAIDDRHRWQIIASRLSSTGEKVRQRRPETTRDVGNCVGRAATGRADGTTIIAADHDGLAARLRIGET